MGPAEPAERLAVNAGLISTEKSPLTSSDGLSVKAFVPTSKLATTCPLFTDLSAFSQ
jgi:hypothetical protein